MKALEIHYLPLSTTSGHASVDLLPNAGDKYDEPMDMPVYLACA